MASAVNVGSINLPKMMRQLSHRTSQVRDLTFVRDAIYRKDTKTTGTTTGTEGNSGSDKALAGPAVNFGYETSSYEQQDAGVDEAYHVDSPEIVLPGLKMLQSPIVSRRGRLEKTGHRISGACTFYAPSLDYIKALDNFGNVKAFLELESYDKLYDMERSIIRVPDNFFRLGSTNTIFFKFDANQSAVDVDRIRYKIKAAQGQDGEGFNNLNVWTKSSVGTMNNTYVMRDAVDKDGVNADIPANASNSIGIFAHSSLVVPTTEYLHVDIPLRLENDREGTSDFASIYSASGTRVAVTGADNDGEGYDLDKCIGDASNHIVALDFNGVDVDNWSIKDIYLYKAAEWRIESIKDYRDEYMQIAAVRVRGDRASRRRAYG